MSCPALRRPRRNVWLRRMGQGAPPAHRRARSARHQADLLSLATASSRSRPRRRRCSELPYVKKRADPAALARYLAVGYVAAPNSLFEGMKKLLPAEALTIESGRVTSRRYWQLPADVNTSMSEAQWIEATRTQLEARGQRSDGERCAARRLPLGRRRFEQRGCANVATHGSSGQDVLDRLSRLIGRGALQRAAFRASGRGAVQDRSPRDHRAAGRCALLPA